jgi:hypothetical protein
MWRLLIITSLECHGSKVRLCCEQKDEKKKWRKQREKMKGGLNDPILTR